MSEIESDDVSTEISPGVPFLGKYEIGKLLGIGAFAKVYHGRNIHTGESVAIKAVSKAKIVKRGLVAHVKREIAIMRRLRHPNVIKLFEVLATKTKIYFVMEYAKGGELFARIAKGRFSEDLSRRYFQQLISAVGYCHSRGVFHRDLKPENLLLDENWDLKVTDFGLGAVEDQIRPDELLHTLCGTPAYVAPELLGRKGYDGSKLDIWSCGVVLFVLTAGYLPFNDSNLMVMYRKIYKGEYRFPKWTSPELRQLLSRLLEPDPNLRITVDGILQDPWFRKGGYEEIKFDMADFDPKPEPDKETFLNAFDLISFSSGFDISGLFNENVEPVRIDRFVSVQKPENIIARIEEVARLEKVNVRRKSEEWWIKIVGQNGSFAVSVEINRLTEKLVVVEIKIREMDAGSSRKIWEEKLRPKLKDLVYKPEALLSND